MLLGIICSGIRAMDTVGPSSSKGLFSGRFWTSCLNDMADKFGGFH